MRGFASHFLSCRERRTGEVQHEKRRHHGRGARHRRGGRPGICRAGRPRVVFIREVRRGGGAARPRDGRGGRPLRRGGRARGRGRVRADPRPAGARLLRGRRALRAHQPDHPGRVAAALRRGRGRHLLLRARGAARDAAEAVRRDRDGRLHVGRGRRVVRGGLFRGQGRGARAHEGAGQGAGSVRHPRERGLARRHRHRHVPRPGGGDAGGPRGRDAAGAARAAGGRREGDGVSRGRGVRDRPGAGRERRLLHRIEKNSPAKTKVFAGVLRSAELFDDLVVRAGGHRIDERVERGEGEQRPRGAQERQGHVPQPEERQKQHDEPVVERDVHGRDQKRREEHHEQLAVDRSADLRLRQADLLHDLEAGAVLVALGHLLVVHDEHGAHHEEDAQEDAEEEEAAVEAVHLLLAFRARGDHVQVPVTDVFPLAGGAARFHGVGAVQPARARGAGRDDVQIAGVGQLQAAVDLLLVGAVEVEQTLEIEVAAGVAEGGFLRRVEILQRRGVRQDEDDHGLVQRERVAEGEGLELPRDGVFPGLHGLAGFAAEKVQKQRVPRGGAARGPDLARPDGERFARDRAVARGVGRVEIAVGLGAADGEAAVRFGRAEAQVEVAVRARDGAAGLLRARFQVREHGVRPEGVAAARGVAHLGADVGGVAFPHGGAGAEIERQRARDHDEHHGRENADVREADRVALHAVEHAGDADEVRGPVIVFLVLPQRLQNEDAHGGEEAVGAEDDEDDRDEIEVQRVEGGLGRDGDPVARAERQNAEDRERPAGPGLALAGLAAAQERHGVLHADAREVAQQRQKEDRREERIAHADGERRDGEAVGPRVAHEAEEEHRHELLQHDAERDAARDAEQGGVERLPREHGGEVALAHAENVVEPQLLRAALHEKAVRVEEENEREQAHHEQADGHERGQVHVALVLGQIPGAGQRAEDVERGDGARDGQQIGDVVAAVLFEVLRGQARIEALIHRPHRPSAAW